MKQKIIIILAIILCLSTVNAAPPEITQVVYEPTPAAPGSIMTVFVQIENKEDTTQTNVAIEIENKYPFEVKEQNKQDVGSITKLGKALTQFKVYVDPSAQNISYDLPIKITSKEQPHGKTTNNKIEVLGKAPILKVTSVSKQKLIPGQETEIEITIKNIGTSTAYDIITELKEDRTIIASGAIIEREITPLGSAITHLEKLEPKQETTQKIRISVNREAQLKNYTIPINISYNTPNGERIEQNNNMGFKVSGQVDFDVILRENNPIVAGKKQELTFELFNKGVGKAEFTIITIQTSIGKIDKPKQFIGSLSPNDVDSFKLNLTVEPNTTTQQATITTTIEYQDTDATTKTKTINIPIQVYSTQDWNLENNTTNPLPIIILLIICAIIVTIGWKTHQKNKKKN